jgi:hypothetical protein
MSYPNTKETWRWVPGYRNLYKVSDAGRVKSVTRVVHMKDGRVQVRTGVVLKPGDLVSPSGKIYKVVSLWRDGKGRMHQVHRLVALAFIPNPDSKPEVNHENGKTSDNRASNLTWMTRLENVEHAISTGLFRHDIRNMPKGVANHNAKLTEEDVRRIKRLVSDGTDSFTAIARKFGVSTMVVYQIRKGLAWSHVN